MNSVHQYLRDQNVTVAALVIYALVGLAVYIGLPILTQYLYGKQVRDKRLLAAASCIFFISLLLPSPLIHGQNTNFTTHFVGGGIFTGFIWLVLKRTFKLRFIWLLELMSLYFLVCGLGVANELFEFFANGIGALRIPGTDTWWDLFANTVGALTFWIGYRLSSFRRS